jgi:hypothetical protein
VTNVVNGASCKRLNPFLHSKRRPKEEQYQSAANKVLVNSIKPPLLDIED